MDHRRCSYVPMAARYLSTHIRFLASSQGTLLNHEFLNHEVTAEKIWASHFGSFFIPLFAHLWPTSTILKKPRFSQLLSIFDLLFEVFVEEFSTFQELKTRCLSHPPSVPITTPLQSKKGKKRRVSSVSLLPQNSSVSNLLPQPNPTITDVTHPEHINHSHLQNLLNLFFTFFPVLKLYKAQLRTSDIFTTINNLQRLLYVLISCPSPSYISALILQLSQFYSWEINYPQVLQHVCQRASFLNEDLGEISLSKLREASPTVSQNPDLLSSQYLSTGMYASFNVSSPLPKKACRPTFVRQILQKKVKNFLLNVYLPQISAPEPYLYYSSLPSRTFKLNPTTTKPDLTSPFPIILKTNTVVEELLKKYTEHCYKLLAPKLPKKNGGKGGKAKKGSKKRTRNISQFEVEEDSEEEELWNGELDDDGEENENVDHVFQDILKHRSKKVGGQKIYEYLVEFDPPDSKGRNTDWIPEDELYDCEELIAKYWNEDL